VFHDGTSHTVPVLLYQREVIVEVGAHDAVLVNADASGFYRVGYSPAAGAALSHLPSGAIAPIERYGLVDDAWAAVVAGGLDPADYLGLVNTFAADDDLSVWQRIIGTLAAIDHLLTDDARPAFAAWVAELLTPVLDRIGSDAGDNDEDRTRELRAAVFGALGTIANHAPTIERAPALLDDDTADPSLRGAAVGVVASVADADGFDDLVRRFQQAETPQDERRYSFALAGVPGRAEFDRLLDMTVDGTIRIQDAPFLLANALSNRRHGPRAWAHVVEHWDTIASTFPSNTLVYLVGGVRALSTRPIADEIAAFLADHPVPQGAKTVAQHLERLRVNVDLRARVVERVPAALG
jgi:puromycin-sensitive aminopeptidase